MQTIVVAANVWNLSVEEIAEQWSLTKAQIEQPWFSTPHTGTKSMPASQMKRLWKTLVARPRVNLDAAAIGSTPFLKRCLVFSTISLVVVSACGGGASAPLPAVASPPAVVETRGLAPELSPMPSVRSTKSPVPSMGNVPSQVPACPTDLGTPLFDTLPVELSDFIAWRPLGFLSPPIHVFPAKHSSFAMNLPGGTPQKKPVKAPGRVWVVEVWAATFSTGGANFQVYFYPCKDFRAYFYHLASVSEKLVAATKAMTPRCNSFNDGSATVTTCRYEGMAIPFEAGEQIGIGPDTAGVDFGGIDFRAKPAAFANLDHYSFDYPYYVSPVDYFTPEVKMLFESKSGSVFGNKLRTAEPKAGSYMQDIVGTAQGNWFSPGINFRTNTDLSSAMALVHDYVDPAQPVFSIGSSVRNVRTGLYSFRPEKDGSINRDFAEVKSDGKTYCYDSFLPGQSAGGLGLARPPGILILTLPTDSTLKIESISGADCSSTASWTFGEQAAIFER